MTMFVLGWVSGGLCAYALLWYRAKVMDEIYTKTVDVFASMMKADAAKLVAQAMVDDLRRHSRRIQ